MGDHAIGEVGEATGEFISSATGLPGGLSGAAFDAAAAAPAADALTRLRQRNTQHALQLLCTILKNVAAPHFRSVWDTRRGTTKSSNKV